jgi:hypothetical protein
VGGGGVKTTKIMDIQSVYRLCKEGIKFLKKKTIRKRICKIVATPVLTSFFSGTGLKHFQKY